MKKHLLLIFFIVTSLTSCSLDSDYSSTFYLEVLPVESVNMPGEFVFGETYEIGLTYNRPSDCYIFNDFLYQTNENERTIAVINTVYTDILCAQVEESVDVNFTFQVTSNDTHVFKFFQGENEEGEDQYYIVEVPVVE